MNRFPSILFLLSLLVTGFLTLLPACSSCEKQNESAPAEAPSAEEDVVSPGVKELWRTEWKLAWQRHGETLKTGRNLADMLSESLDWGDVAGKLPDEEKAWPRLNALRVFLAAMEEVRNDGEKDLLSSHLERMRSLSLDVQTGSSPSCGQFLARLWENEILMKAVTLGLKVDADVPQQVTGTLRWWDNVGHLPHPFTAPCHRALARADFVPKEMDDHFYFYGLEWLIHQLDRVGRTEEALAAAQIAAGRWKDDPKWILHQDNLMPLMQDMDRRLAETRQKEAVKNSPR